MERDERSRHRRFGTVFVLALILKVEEALAGDPAGSAEAAGTSALPSVVLRAVPDAATKLPSPACREDAMPSSPDCSSAIPILHPRDLNAIVRMAVVEAHHRLGGPECRLLFTDFQDESGYSLQDRLESIGQSGQSYLGWIWFVNSEQDSRCLQSNVLAFTSPHSQVVYYCGDRFSRNLTQRGLGSLATTIIHEELHSLGLGENPPSAQKSVAAWRSDVALETGPVRHAADLGFVDPGTSRR
jgi:hypothetical protein